MASKASLKRLRDSTSISWMACFGVADGIEQVLPLGVQEVVALLRFLEFFERLRIHRAQRFDARLHFLILLLGFFQTRFIQNRLFARGKLFQGRVELLAAGFVQVFQLGLFLHQLQFDLRSVFLRGLDVNAQLLERFFQRRKIRA